MYSRIAIIAMAMAICHAFPQHSYGGGFGHNYAGHQEYEGFEEHDEAQSVHFQHAPVVRQVAAAPVVNKVSAPVVHKVAVPVVEKVAVPVVHKVPVPVVEKVAVPVVHKVAAPEVHKVDVPVVHKEEKVEVEHYPPPHYKFEYGVNDEKTGDIKNHHEERHGDNTKGYYSLHEPDGTILTVHYTVEKDSGFQAVVEKKGKAEHPEKIEHHQPVVYHKAIKVQSVYHKAIEVQPVYHKVIEVQPVYHKVIEVQPVYHKAVEVAPVLHKSAIKHS